MNDRDEAERQGAKMSVLHRIGSFFSLHEEDDEPFEEELEPVRRNVVAFSPQSRRPAPEVALFAPRGFADVTDIADALRNRQVVIVNLQGADRALLQRVVDFVSGVAYTLDGKIQKLADAMYLVAPPGIAVNSAGLRESLGGDALLDFMTNRGEGR
ncbi:MAG TPA: cell division protein SepF [Candidatus Baltobacteraceae bacterium]|nr:cell division protein SepF [Candidatus Baltobacteraceae bacterium]